MTFQRGCSSDIKIPKAENEKYNDTASPFFKKITRQDYKAETSTLKNEKKKNNTFSKLARDC